MEYISIDEVRSLSGYSDLRSIRKWLAELHVELLRIGKNYCVSKSDFEAAINNKYRNKNTNTQQVKPKYTPKSKCEKEFLADLTSTLTKL